MRRSICVLLHSVELQVTLGNASRGIPLVLPRPTLLTSTTTLGNA